MYDALFAAWNFIGEAVRAILKLYAGLAVFYPVAYVIKHKKLPPF